MALLGNISLLHKSPAKYTTGTVGFNDRANWNKPGMMRNRGNLTLSTLWKYDAVPSGQMAGRAFLAPQKAGRMVTRSAFNINGSAIGALGKPGSASANFAITGNAIGGLIAGGVANCVITISGNAVIAGLASGNANGTISITGNAVAGATAWGVANGAFNVSGSVVGYGLAYGNASTVDNSVMTPATITAAVWNAVSADYAAAGSMGAKLNSAASGGVDYTALGAAVWASVSRTLTAGTPPDTEAIAAAVLDALNTTAIPVNTVKMNGATILGDGSSTNLWRGE
jgi:hypothetical protein